MFTLPSKAQALASAKHAFFVCTIAVLMFMPKVAAASRQTGRGGFDNAPWRDAFQTIINELQGDTGRLIGVGMLIVGGITWGFTRHQKGANKIAQAIIAIGVIIGATSLSNVLFSSALM